MKWVLRESPRLYHPSDKERFLAVPPYSEEAEAAARKAIRGRTYPRKELSDLLVRYNREIGNDEVALKNCERLAEEDAVCVITGQQLGLLGGPTYTILKAVTCLLMAREMGALPLFWIASEDHDVDEIDHTYLLGPLGNFQKFHVTLPKEGRFVESLLVTEKILEEVEELCSALDLAPPSREWIGKRYVNLMLHFLMPLFRGTGLLFVEPYLLRPLAKDFFHKELEDWEPLHSAISSTTEALGESPISLEEPGQLFLKVQEKYRKKIKRDAEGFHAGSLRFTQEELHRLIDEEPERFSTNAAARPVLQSLLFPTLAYVGGPGEIAYHHQLKEYFALHGAVMPWIVPRLSATFVPPSIRTLLEKCSLEPWDEIPYEWEKIFPRIAEESEALTRDWTQTAKTYLGEDLSHRSLETFTGHAASRLMKKAVRARLKEKNIPSYGLHLLRNFLHPRGGRQERVFNWFGFQAAARENLIGQLLSEMKWNTQGHLYCYYD